MPAQGADPATRASGLTRAFQPAAEVEPVHAQTAPAPRSTPAGPARSGSVTDPAGATAWPRSTPSGSVRAGEVDRPRPVALADDVVLGIDFGTTTCRVAVVVDGQPRLIPIPSERGAVAMPSVVAFDPARDAMLVGSQARTYRVEHPGLAMAGLKRLLGRRARSRRVKDLAPLYPCTLAADPEGDVGVELAGQVHGLAELAACLLRELRQAAQEFIGRPLTRAVLCVPAWYSDHQRAAVLEAGRAAGLDVLSILNEPSAVALAFGYGRGLARKRVLVYDLGGGTFDASVVEITGDDLEVVSTGGDDFLGGMDFDARLADVLVGTLAEGPRERLVRSKVAVQRVRDAAEVAKIALSAQDVASVAVPFATTSDAGEPVDLKADVERGYLEAATADLVERTAQVTQVVLDAAGLSEKSLDEVLLVGGQSRAPAVRQRVEQALRRAPRADIDPQAAVALGAALYGATLVEKERGKRGLRLSEVLAAPIGVGLRGGAFRKVLERNTRLPAEKTLVVPVQANAPLAIAIFQGLAPRAEDNEYLGVLHAASDRPGELQLRFVVSADGRLTVSGITPGTPKSEASFSTAQASDELQAQILAQSPLRPDDERAAAQGGLFGGLRRLLGRT